METVVLIPAYNEEETIEEIIVRLKKMDGITPLVIDDCSSDKTVHVAKKQKAIVIEHNKNKGKGEALITGFDFILKKMKNSKYVVILDADLQYMPEDIPRLIEPLKKNEADYVTGYRNWLKVPFRHTLGNFVWRFSFNLLFGTEFKDTNCGFIAMNRKAIKILAKKSYGGYIIENVMLVEAIKNDLRIKQVPIDVYYYEKRGVLTGSRFVLGNLAYIIETGIKRKFGIELKLYEKIEELKLIFTKGSD